MEDHVQVLLVYDVFFELPRLLSLEECVSEMQGVYHRVYHFVETIVVVVVAAGVCKSEEIFLQDTTILEAHNFSKGLNLDAPGNKQILCRTVKKWNELPASVLRTIINSGRDWWTLLCSAIFNKQALARSRVVFSIETKDYIRHLLIQLTHIKIIKLGVCVNCH